MIRMVSPRRSTYTTTATINCIHPTAIQRSSPKSSRPSAAVRTVCLKISTASVKSMPCLRMLLRFFTSSHSNCMRLPVLTIVHTMYGVEVIFRRALCEHIDTDHEMLQLQPQKQKRPIRENRPLLLSDIEPHTSRPAIRPLRLRWDRRDRFLASFPSPGLRASRPATWRARPRRTPTNRYRTRYRPGRYL